MTTAAASAPRRPRALPRLRSIPLPRPELGALLLLAAVLNLWALDTNGWANEYYSAAVRSMSESWHAFLFGTFDAAGVMTVDKPPLALWVQALSVRVFGFHSLSILVPQALMGVATVALAYDLVRRRFGRRAGFVAGLVLALTPITVAISRHNNPDALLVLCCTGRAVGAGPRARGRPHALARARRRARRARLRDQDGRRADGRAGHRGRRTWVAPKGRSPRCASCSRAARRWSPRAAWPVLVCAHAGVRPAVDLGHRGQLDLVADPRLQRPRPADRPGRRPGRRRRGGGGGAACSAARPAGCACSTRAWAARPAGSSASRSSPASRCWPRRGCAAPTPARAG